MRAARLINGYRISASAENEFFNRIDPKQSFSAVQERMEPRFAELPGSSPSSFTVKRRYDTPEALMNRLSRSAE
jgi:hypothetical protein